MVTLLTILGSLGITYFASIFGFKKYYQKKAKEEKEKTEVGKAYLESFNQASRTLNSIQSDNSDLERQLLALLAYNQISIPQSKFDDAKATIENCEKQKALLVKERDVAYQKALPVIKELERQEKIRLEKERKEAEARRKKQQEEDEKRRKEDEARRKKRREEEEEESRRRSSYSSSSYDYSSSSSSSDSGSSWSGGGGDSSGGGSSDSW